MKKSILGTWMYIIGAIYIPCYTIGLFALITVTCMGIITFLTFLISFAGLTMELIIILCLCSAYNKIEKLEKTVLYLVDIKNLHYSNTQSKTNKNIAVQDTEQIIKSESDENISICRKCGYQLFDDDTECPNCHSKISK